MKVPVQLSETCKADSELMMARPDAHEPPLFNDRLYRRDGGVDERLEDWIFQGGDGLAFLSWCGNSDEWTLQLMRLDQDEHAIGQQVLPDSLEGIDHALDFDSSKRPAEKCHLEWVATKAQPYG